MSCKRQPKPRFARQGWLSFRDQELNPSAPCGPKTNSLSPRGRPLRISSAGLGTGTHERASSPLLGWQRDQRVVGIFFTVSQPRPPSSCRRHPNNNKSRTMAEWALLLAVAGDGPDFLVSQDVLARFGREAIRVRRGIGVKKAFAHAPRRAGDEVLPNGVGARSPGNRA